MTEKGLTWIRIEILTPDRIQALHVVKAVGPLLADLVLTNPAASLDIHTCSEEVEKKGES